MVGFADGMQIGKMASTICSQDSIPKQPEDTKTLGLEQQMTLETSVEARNKFRWRPNRNPAVMSPKATQIFGPIDRLYLDASTSR